VDAFQALKNFPPHTEDGKKQGRSATPNSRVCMPSWCSSSVGERHNTALTQGGGKRRGGIGRTTCSHPLVRRHSREIIEIVTPQSLTIKAGVFATD
jgi:hypothetical protein